MTQLCWINKSKLAGSVLLAALLTACGGGGGGDGGSGSGATVGVSGTVARGAVLGGAVVSMACANGASVNAVANANGIYAATATIAYPCIGSATSGTITYRGILFSGGIANFTPLTDLLVETVLAASASGPATLTVAEFLTRIRSDQTFANSVSNASAVAAFRSAVLATVRAQLISAGFTAASADAILNGAALFESTLFIAGSALDVVLDNTAIVLLDTLGRLKAVVIAAAAAAGNTLPTPAVSATGATGATGATAGSGSGT